LRSILISVVGLLAGCTSQIHNAQNNDALAQYQSGNCAYAYNEWHDLAYEKKNIYGINNLGLIFEKGCAEAGISQNPAAAFNLYKTAADNGLPAGMNNVGASYEFGIYVAKNMTAALSYYSLAARYGETQARSNLMRLGKNLPKMDLLYEEQSSGNEVFGDFLRVMGKIAEGTLAAYASQGPVPAARVEQTKCHSTSNGIGGVNTTCRTY